MFWLKANELEKHKVQRIKKLTGPFSTVKWDFLRGGTLSSPSKNENKLNSYWKQSIGRSLVEATSSMMKAVLITTTSFKTSKLGFDFWRKKLAIILERQYLRILLVIPNLP